MTAFGRAVLTILWKDVLLEVRTKDIVTPILVFAFLVVIIFNFAFEPTPDLVAVVAPGVLWVAFTFAGVLGLNRTFALEKDKGSLEGLMLAPVGRDAIYFGKLLGSFLFMLAVELLMLVPFLVLFNVRLFSPEFLVTAVVATLGFAAVGTVFSAIAVNTRAREIMLPILFFPIVVPVIIGAVESSSLILEKGSWSDIAGWVQLMAAFDAIFLVVSSITFQFVLEE